MKYYLKVLKDDEENAPGIDKKYCVKYRVKDDTDRHLYFVERINPSPARKGLKLINVVRIDIENVSNPINFNPYIILVNHKLTITEIYSDFSYRIGG